MEHPAHKEKICILLFFSNKEHGLLNFVVKLLAIVLYIQMVLSSILSPKNDSPKFFVICLSPFKTRDKWIPFTTAWHILRLQMKDSCEYTE